MPWELVYGTPLDSSAPEGSSAVLLQLRSVLHAEGQQQGTSRQLYPELQSRSQAGAGSPHSGDSGPHSTRSKQPWQCQRGRQAASTEHQQTTEACVLLCVLKNPHLFPAVSLHLQAHTLQVYTFQSLPYHPCAPCSFQISRHRLLCT